MFAPRRDYRAFLTAISTQPGFGFRLASVAAFSTALAVDKGAMVAAIIVGSALAGVVTFGFLWWRRWGP